MLLWKALGRWRPDISLIALELIMAVRRGKSPDGGGRKVPPFGRRNHELTHKQARAMREAYIKRHQGKSGELRSGVYGRGIFEKILKQKGCVGIRFYPGLDEKGNVTVLFVGVDAEGNDILRGLIGDSPWNCPPFCSSPNGVLFF
jgi:hypothetical protein